MPRKGSKKIVEGLDHAFELALVLITVISGIIAQFVADEQQINLPPIIANMRRLSIVFVFPSILTISAWIVIYFIDDETQKMRLKTYAWSSIIFLIVLEVTELCVLCRPPRFPEWLNFLILFPFGLSMFFPLIPLLLIEHILNRYKTVLKDIDFFTWKGKFGTLKRYTPFLLSYIVFWLAFFAATSA